MFTPFLLPRAEMVSRNCTGTAHAAAVLGALFSAGLCAGQFKSNPRLVVLHVSVMKSNGDLLGKPGRNQFTVYENGTAQEAVEAAGLWMVEASNHADQTCIVNFNDEAFINVPSTGDVRKMIEGLARIDARGGTAAFDAVQQTLLYLAKSASKDKRVILLITDGNDNGSKIGAGQITQLARQSGVIVSAIGLLRGQSRDDSSEARKALNALTITTGGGAFYPKNVREVNRIVLEIAKEIRSQYTIAYVPSVAALDGTFRKINVQVSGSGKPKVRTRTGYRVVMAEETGHDKRSNPAN